ncbi:MAG: outer membrane beta-barrel protein [Bacteroidales bacterium]
MKKLFLLLFVSFFAFTQAYSQTEKGNFMTFGSTHLNVNWKTGKVENKGMSSMDMPKRFSLDLIPAVGYFVTNNWAAGLAVDFRLKTSKNTYMKGNSEENYYPNKEHAIILAPFTRYYINVGHDKMMPFVEANFNIGWGNKKTETPDGDGNLVKTDDKTDIIGFGVSPGIAFFFNDHVSLDFGLYYQYESIKLDNALDTTHNNNNFGVNFGFSVYF